MITIAAVVLLIAGLIASYAAARRLFPAHVSLLAVVTIAAGSFLIGELVRGPSIAAALSIAAVGLTLVVAAWNSKVSTASWRWIVVVFVAALVIALRGGLMTTNAGSGPIDALWSLPDGLFATSPAIYLAALGFIPLWRRDRQLATSALVILLLTLAMAARTKTQFDVMVPFFVCGMAAALDIVTRAAARRPALAATAVLSVLVLWNMVLVGVTKAGGHHIGEPVSFGDLGAAQAETMHDWIGHPPSYPANLIYAIRHGVAPGRYDVLRPHRFFANTSRRSESIDIGVRDEIFLQDGWHATERAGPLTYRWSQRDARLIVPFDHADDVRVALRIHAFTYPGSPAQTMLLTINGRPLPPLAVGPDWHDVQWDVSREYWRGGINHLSLRFAYEMRPSAVGGGGDNRALAAAIDTIRFTIGR